MKAKRYDRAFSDLEFILRYFPNHPQALAMMADICDVQWKDPRCDTNGWFQKAIERNPGAAQTWLVYGIHLQYINQPSAAIDSYKKSIELNPSSANAHYNLGLAYFDNRQFELANRQAQLAALLGMSLPGLRDKLTRTGKWKMLDQDELRREIAAVPSGVGAPKAD
jgi:tetratricopeptide (TPR) repeat protein